MGNLPRFTTTTKRPSSATLAIHKIANNKAIAIGGTMMQLEDLFMRHGRQPEVKVTALRPEELTKIQPKVWKTVTGSKLDKDQVAKALQLGLILIEGEYVSDVVDSISSLAQQLRRTDTMAVFVDWD